MNQGKITTLEETSAKLKFRIFTRDLPDMYSNQERLPLADSIPLMEPDKEGKIRVLRIIARMNLGGPAIQISGIARHLDNSRFEQLLVTGYCEEDERDFLEIQPLQTDVLRIENFGRSISLLRDIRTIFELLKIIRNWKPHIVHTHTAKAGFVGRVASLLAFRRIKLVHTFHGHVFYGYFSKPKSQAFVWIERILAKFTHVLIAVGESVAKEIVNYGVGKMEQFSIIPPGLAVNKNISKQEAITAYGLPENTVLIGFIGRIAPIKRPDRFIEIVRLFNNFKMQVHFVVAGDGTELPEILKISKAELLPITFLGWVDDISNLLPAIDLMVLTSDNEGTPVSLIQGAMLGIPAVATNVGSVSEVLINEKTGFLTDKTVIHMFEALKKLVLDEELRIQFSASARKFAKQRFGEERLALDHAKLYRDLISG